MRLQSLHVPHALLFSVALAVYLLVPSIVSKPSLGLVPFDFPVEALVVCPFHIAVAVRM